MARAIQDLNASPAEKACLMSLFTYELASSGAKNAPFRKEYRSEIEKHVRPQLLSEGEPDED